MRLKSYFAGTVESAMSLASRELGPEAMLVGSRPAPPEACRPGEYEVVFAAPPQPPPAGNTGDGPAAGAQAAGQASAAPQPWEKFSRELREVLKSLERAAECMVRAQAVPFAAGHPDTASCLSTLLEAGFTAEVAHDIVAGVRLRLGHTALARERRPASAGSQDRERYLHVLRDELESRIRVDASLDGSASGARVVAVVGPSGSGKTTTLVKLAARFGLKARRPVQVLSMDTHRIAAADQLRRYAAILGVGFQVFDTPRAVAQAIEEHRNKQLILIDTPGSDGADSEVRRDLAFLFAAQPEVDVHLVLPASMKPSDLARAADRFRDLGAAKLIFTRLDETSSPGSAACEAIRSALPVSFLCHGQQIPEDIDEATPEKLAETVLALRIREEVAAA